MNKLLLATLITFATWSLMAQEKFVIDKVVSKVGSETILLSDVEAQFAFSKEKIVGESDNEVKCQILGAIIGQKLIVHQARLDSIEVSDDEIESQLDFRIDGVLRQMNGDEKLFEEFYGMSIIEMRGNLRDDLEQQLLAERMQAKILSNVNITPSEIKDFYKKIPQDSLPYLNAEVELGEIVLKPEVNDEERTKALQTIISIRKKIKAGTHTFEELAQLYSDDPGSGAKGGDLGFAERGTFVPAFEAAAFSLDKGEMSEPVESVFGFHIIELIERRGNRLHLRHILVKPEITYADLELAAAELDSIRADILAEKITFAAAVSKYGLDDVQSFHNGGRMQNPNTGKTVFQTSELPPEVYFATEEMEIKEISEALEFPQLSGETFYRLIQLQSRTKPHRASLEQDYTKLQNFAKESKKSEYFAKWVDKKMKTTPIEIDKNYLQCPDLDRIIK